MEKNNSRFSLFASRVAIGAGKGSAFALAFISMLVWLLVGIVAHFDNDWKEWAALYMSAVTFMLVFIIQHTQNRDTMALHLKLDELIRSTHGAHTSMLKVEDLSDQEMIRLGDSYKSLADDARELVHGGQSDIHTPDMELIKKTGGE